MVCFKPQKWHISLLHIWLHNSGTRQIWLPHILTLKHNIVIYKVHTHEQNEVTNFTKKSVYNFVFRFIDNYPEVCAGMPVLVSNIPVASATVTSLGKASNALSKYKCPITVPSKLFCRLDSVQSSYYWTPRYSSCHDFSQGRWCQATEL